MDSVSNKFPSANGVFNANGASVSTTFGQDVYTDLSNLNNINRLADQDEQTALKKLAMQFEGFFIQLLLKTMREACNESGD